MWLLRRKNVSSEAPVFSRWATRGRSNPSRQRQWGMSTPAISMVLAKSGNVKTAMTGRPDCLDGSVWLRYFYGGSGVLDVMKTLLSQAVVWAWIPDFVPFETAHDHVSLVIGDLQQWHWWGQKHSWIQFWWCSSSTEFWYLGWKP
jgi:hypothetical protein